MQKAQVLNEAQALLNDAQLSLIKAQILLKKAQVPLNEYLSMEQEWTQTYF